MTHLEQGDPWLALAFLALLHLVAKLLWRGNGPKGGAK